MLVYSIPTNVCFRLVKIQMFSIIVLHSIDICTVATKNTKNMRAFSTNQIADILRFNDKGLYRKL